MADNKALLIAEMDRQGIRDNTLRAGIAAIVGGESGWVPRSEDSYSGTSNSRIRSIFVTAMRGKSDDFITNLKRDDEAFFNYVYGPHGAGAQLGNFQAGDGYRFRGRGGPQLTGRGNYARLSEMTGLDLVGNPDLVNDPAVSAAVTVGYMRWRYKGGGWSAIKAAVGNSFGTVDERKNELFARFQQSGEFDFDPAKKPMAPAAPMPDTIEEKNQVMSAVLALKVIQKTLADQGLYKRAIDGDFGDNSRDALDMLLRQAHQRPLYEE